MLSTIAMSVMMTFSVIITHYFALRAVARFGGVVPNRIARDLLSVALIFVLHLCEVLYYALHLYIAHHVVGIEGFPASENFSFVEYLHTALTAFTTLGSLEIKYTSWATVLIDFISLTGFTMLTWSATFYYSLFSSERHQNA